MSVQGFTNIIQGPLAEYLHFSQLIGADVAQHSLLVQDTFQTQLQFLKLASLSAKPTDPTDIMNLLKPTSDCITAIQEFREKNRSSQYFNHLSAISESIPALGWVAVSPAPAPYIKEMNDAGQFYTNRVLKEWKEKNKIHVDWVKAWVQTLSDLQTFVKQYHTTGLEWSGRGAASAVPPPPPPRTSILPPPPPPDMSFATPVDSGPDRSALFAQLNQGANVTSHLKKVTSDMQTHKNPELKQSGPVSGGAGLARNGADAQFNKPPKCVKEGKKWIIEYQKGNHQLVVDGAEMNNVVYLYKCINSTVIVKGKINSIMVDDCTKTAIVFDSLVSSIEFINCKSVQMQVFGKVPTISIDKTDGCQIYLSQDAMDVEIVTAKSSEMNVLLPKGNGDYAELPIPEQFKTTITPNKRSLSTVVVESTG